MFYDYLHLQPKDTFGDFLPTKIEEERKEPNFDTEKYISLINFNGKSIDGFKFKEFLVGDSRQFVQAQVIIGDSALNGYLDLTKHSCILNKIKALPPKEASRKINDYILTLSSEDEMVIKEMQAFMHLGIEDKSLKQTLTDTSGENIGNLICLFDKFFLGKTIKNKISNYLQKCDQFSSDEGSLKILNRIFKIGLATKIFNGEFLLTEIPDQLKSDEFEIASQARLNSSKAIIDSASISFYDFIYFLLCEGRTVSKSDLGIAISRLIGNDDYKQITLFLLSQGADVSASVLGEVILKLTHNNCRDEVLSILLTDRTIDDEFLWQSVLYAVFNEDIELVSSLLLKSYSVSDYFLSESLVLAISNSRSDIIGLLLTKCDVISEKYLWPIVEAAVKADNQHIVELFISKCPTNEKSLGRAVFEAVINQNQSIFELIFSKDSKISPKDLGKAIEYAVFNKDRLILESLLEGDREISSEYLSKAIISACFSIESDPEYEEILEIIFSRNIKIEQEYLNNIIENLASVGLEKILRMLFRNKIIIDPDSLTRAIYYAYSDKHYSVVEFLLSKAIVVKIPSHIKKDIADFKKKPSKSVGSWEGLLNKLIAFAEYHLLNEDIIKIIKLALKRLADNIPFFGSPSQINIEMVNSWYIHIKRILSTIDDKIDLDPTKNGEEKANIINALGRCGGAWQAELEQIQQQLIEFPETFPVELIIGKIIDDSMSSIIQLINFEYAKSKEIQPDVHDENRIKFYLKDFIVDGFYSDTIFDDHLSTTYFNKIETIIEMSKKFNLKTVGEIILNNIIEKDVFAQKLNDYYRKELFKDHPSTEDIDKKIELDEVVLLIELENLGGIQAFFRNLNLIINDKLSFEEQIRLLNLSHQFCNKKDFTAVLKYRFKKTDGSVLFNDEEINLLFEKRVEFLSNIEKLKQIKTLTNASFFDITRKTKEQLIQLFFDTKQLKVEKYLLEDFECEHTKDGILTLSGINLILEKMGFLD